MSTAILKRSLGDAGAAIDESHGAPSILRQVLTALANLIPPFLSAAQATVATGVQATACIDQAGDYDIVLRTDIGTTGTAGSTTVKAQQNGSDITNATTTTANTEADGTSKRGAATSVTLAAGDIITINVTAAPTGGANGTYSLYLKPVHIET